MTKMKALKLMTMALVFASATMMFAANINLGGTTAKVPFDFQVGQTTLPAGEYEVRVIGNAVMLISESGEKGLALSHGVEAGETREQSALDFVKVNGTYQLARVWHAGQERGQELSVSTKESKLAQNGDVTRIAVGK
jgi:hypothetical protein